VDRLVLKLDDAPTTLGEGEYADAVGKVAGYQAPLTRLATAPEPKTDPTTASALSARAQGVIDCISTVG
jgi:hypothetical protein